MQDRPEFGREESGVLWHWRLLRSRRL